MINPDKIGGRLGNRMFQLAYLYAQTKRGKISDIYVQDPQYFEEFADEIRALYGSGIGLTDKVSIHVRRGDYVDNPFYVDLSKTDYYQKALKQFSGEKFLVFSDDIQWCKYYFLGSEFEFSEGNALDDLNKMASCKGHIISNSSFSWWGAYLGFGKVVAPKAWYVDNIERTKCPNTWIKL